MAHPKQIEHNKLMSVFYKDARIKECLHPNQAECKGAIKKTHSIQRNGRLSIMEGEVGGVNGIYSFLTNEYDWRGGLANLKLLGKGEASTFFGFCDYHDSTLFSPIENFEFDGSDKHLFLHSYRAHAHSYYMKKGSINAYEKKSDYTKILPEENLDATIFSSKLGLKDMQSSKGMLDDMLLRESYSELEYFFHIVPRLHPVACSASFSPRYSYSGEKLNTNPLAEYWSSIMLTVLPDISNQSIIIMACLPHEDYSIKFIDSISDLPNHKLEKAVSSIMIDYLENTFISPLLWNAFSRNEKNKLLLEIEQTAPHSLRRIFNKGFFNSFINFFDVKYQQNKLLQYKNRNHK
ncbi:hypothetical protein [Hymenobacter jeollabukensis]|uniref:Uncharacterized protein n=1 Tax=Hymenobacter jeollabukensis TaxID=2025313 RepID=A0A5R8WLL4_9BACT|nr:hypothetical protein [Hymenobacter jeollabukensis]TLM90101.1 hypothetical protein FDY95_18980 [Hymenobacter jeollabukensis]